MNQSPLPYSTQGRMVAPAGLSFGASWLRKMYGQGENQ